MERKIDSAMKQTVQGAPGLTSSPVTDDTLAPGRVPIVAHGKLDARSIILAVLGGAGFFALAVLCISLSRFDSALAAVWFPNASAVALLLLTRPRNELVTYIAFAVACVAANMWAGDDAIHAAGYTLANLVEIALVTWLLRRSAGERLDLTDLASLGRFLQYGGVVGPLASSLLITCAFAWGAPGRLDTTWSNTTAWFMANSMGMILIVPAALLIADARKTATRHTRPAMIENTLLIIGGLLAVVFVFKQDVYPLLFLAPPVTLLIAFRLGGLGTALYVPGLAILASALTYAGVGPIVNNSTSELSQTYLIQVFTAVNFVTGLPIAAILAGRERLTEELARGRREVALLTESITDAVMRLDSDGVCTYASPSVIDVLGRTPDDLVGRTVLARTHVDSRERISEVLERLLAGASEKERFTYRRLLDGKDGSPVFIEADCAIMLDPVTGERDGIVVSARDVTERVKLELLLTRARAHAENAAHAKSEFLANMSHEIRTPMNGVLGFAELMLQGDLDEQNRRHTEMIVQSGRSMMLLLNDILDLSKIEAGQIAIDKEPVDLFATIDECAALHRPTAENKGLELSFHRPAAPGSDRTPDGGTGRTGSPRPWVVTDGLRLRQIILNLVGNAVKFTQKGRVDIHFHADEKEFSIEVHDTGIGVSQSRLKTIFAPFTQGESDTARRFGGTGLGLTISRQLAELLGGTIEVRSRQGEGSIFRLTLPAIYAEEQEETAVEPSQMQPVDLLQSSRILLVEDHDVNRLLCTEMLERCGQTVAIAHDGNEAIAMVIDSMMRGTPYDLVLMDIQMPGCDGYAATRAIRAEGITPDMIPIVALTANAFPEDIAAARDAGMQAHLAKPLVFSDLARALQRWLPTRIVDDECEAASDRRNTGVTKTVLVEAPDPKNALEPVRDRDAASPRVNTAAKPEAQAPRPHAPPQTHSPALLNRWNERRGEAIEAVREALDKGLLREESPADEAFDHLARLVHKLAGTAAIFGEPELGEQASAFERALRTPLGSEELERMANEILTIADDPAQPLAQTGT